MPLGEFASIENSLEASGYRLSRLRPYGEGKVVKVAAIWNRDGLRARFALGRSAAEIREMDEKNRKDGFAPVDVAGYLSSGENGEPLERYAAVWVKASGGGNVAIYVGETAGKFAETKEELNDDGVIPRTSQVMLAMDGQEKYSGVWGAVVEPHRIGWGDGSVRSRLRRNAREATRFRHDRRGDQRGACRGHGHRARPTVRSRVRRRI